MCGRYILAQQAKAERAFGITRLRWHDMLSYNVPPSTLVPVVRTVDGVREGVMMRWGLVPFYLKGENPKFATMNARIETMETSPAYRGPWKRGQRCIVPATGFYEWQVLPDGRKQPWFIGITDQECMGFAALWERSEKADGTVIESFTIITLPANDFMADIHNVKQRMPAILTAEGITPWLEGTLAEAKAALVQYPATRMQAWPVSSRVNSPRNDDADLMTPLAS
jgi:putative SOS response-associated peptidase YedK